MLIVNEPVEASEVTHETCDFDSLWKSSLFHLEILKIYETHLGLSLFS